MYNELIKRLRTECTLPYTTLQLMREAANIIEELQANTRPVMRGHWIDTKEAEEMDDIMKEFTCSVCGCCDWDCAESESFNFCPNCGADMRGEN